MKISKLPPHDIKRNHDMYEKYTNIYRMEDGWLPGNKEKNFYAMAKIADLTGVPISGSSCLDAGCGTGDLSLFLRKRGARKYLGFDIYEPSLILARKKYPYEKFMLADILSFHIKDKFDYVFCSGALTVNLSIDNYDYLESTILRMWELTRTGLVFNILTSDDYQQDHDLFYYDPQRIIMICNKVDPTASVYIEGTPDEYQAHVYMYR